MKSPRSATRQSGSIPRNLERHEDGYALLIVLAMIGLSAVYFSFSLTGRIEAWGSHPVNRLSPRTADALRQAKEALIGFAATYADRNPGNVFGYLPLPDLGSSRERNIACSGEGCTPGVFLGDRQDMTVIGRLPWQSLNIPPLKDEYGECLWYAVSGSFQSAVQTATMNWDTLSYLDATSPDGQTSLSGGNAHGRAVAIVFSAGPPLAGQNRSPSGADDVNQCGGNYDVRNYLDPHDVTVATGNLLNWYPDSTNSATDPAATLPPTTVKGMLANPLPGNLATLNDRAILITSNDIFRIVQRRADFIQPTLTAIRTCLATYYSANSSYPDPSSDLYQAGDALQRGRLPGVCNDPLAPDQTATRYALHFFYFKCQNGNSSCLRAWSSDTPCKAAVAFGGARGSGQSRRTDAERAAVSNYLETPALDAYTSGGSGGAISLGGIAAFNADTPNTDVILCLN